MRTKILCKDHTIVDTGLECLQVFGIQGVLEPVTFRYYIASTLVQWGFPKMGLVAGPSGVPRVQQTMACGVHTKGRVWAVATRCDMSMQPCRRLTGK